MKHSTSRVSGLRSALFVAAATLSPTLVGCSEDASESSTAAALQGSAGSANNGAMNGSAGGGSAGGGSAGEAGSGGVGASSAGAAGAAGTGSGQGSEPETESAPDAGAAFTLESPAFEDNPGCGPEGDEPAACDLFAVDNTGLGDGADVSPALEWSGAPADTRSFAIAFHDLSNIAGQSPFTHWVMWNIPATSTGLPAELPAGTEPGVPAENTRQVSFRGDNAFAGSGRCGNVYELVLYALSVSELEPPDTSSADAVQGALEASGDVLDTATMRGRSNPDGPCD